jgi:heat shock protein HslJ
MLCGASLLALAIAGCAEEPGPPSSAVLTPLDDTREAVPTTTAAPTTSQPDPLTRIEWQLVEMVVSGRTVSADGIDAVLRFDGSGGYSANACNFVEGEVEIGDGTLVLAAGMTTEMFCDGLGGEIDSAIHSLAGAPVTWTRDGGGLVLSGANGTTLRYRVRDSIYPDAENQEVVAGERDGWQYRLSVTSDSGQLTGMSFVSRSGPGVAWGQHSIGAPSPGEAPLWALGGGDVAGDFFVAGFAPVGAASATHQATSSEPPLPLEIYDVDDSQWVVIGGFVPEHTKDSVISVYDATGALVAEWRHT